MDADMPVLMPPGRYEEMERGQMAGLNRRPLRIEVSDDAVRFRVRFQVRFEGHRDNVQADFATLRRSLLAGLDLVWNQTLQRVPLAGRRFEILPVLSLVSATAPRDLDYWLITVRPSDAGPIVYEGRSLGDSPGGLPTSATDASVDGGVMSVPPLHIGLPGVLGHEVMHLFGLIDRYMTETAMSPSGTATGHRNVPLRETGGRPDPLAAADARILGEDLAFVFEQLGVYELEANRGLDTLRQLESQGMTYGQAAGELHRQEEIIRLGHDPYSLIPERRDFRDRVLQSAEDL